MAQPAAAAAPAPVAAAEASSPTAAAAVAPVTPDGVRVTQAVATVNGRDIAAERFNQEFEHLLGRGARIPQDRLRRIAKNVLNKLVESELRAQAIEREQVTITELEFDEAWREFAARFQDGQGRFDEAAFHNELARTQMTEAQVRAQVREQRLGRKLVEKLGKVDVTETELKAFYDNNPSAWTEAASRDVRPILVRLAQDARPEQIRAAEQKAQEAATALRKGGDFEEIARSYNDAPLSPIHVVRGNGDAELEKAAFALKVGEVSAPIRTRWGFYVLRLLEKNEQRERSYAEVRDEIRKTLTSRRMYQEDRRIVEDLRHKAEVIEKLPF
jgi:parvulin-like peptidyl-prolyl isomerase